MKNIRRLLLVFSVFIPLTCHAEVMICPWLNQATAAGVLGGSVRLLVVGASMDDMACKFDVDKDSATNSLQIEVIKLRNLDDRFEIYRQKCSSQASPLQAIGNEAFMCKVASQKKQPGGKQEEMVFGRVRSHEFIVTLSSGTSINQSMADEPIEVKARNIAEQVADSLY